MAKTPQGSDLSSVLNLIRKGSSNAYQTSVPLATATNIADVGMAVVRAIPSVRNEFMANLYNKVGLTLIDTPIIENEFSNKKKGVLEYGQTIEDIYIGMATSEAYVTGMHEGDETPDPFTIKKLPHKSAFYSTILSRQYQVTRHLTDLKKAFNNGQSLAEFVAGIMQSMVSAENWDDYRATIALVARQIEASQTAEEFKGNVHLITAFNVGKTAGNQVTAANCLQNQNFLKYFSNQLKKYSKRLKHVRSDLNIVGVDNNLPLSRQKIMILEDITVDFETELLAWAYRGDTFLLGEVEEIPSWYSIGVDEDGVSKPEDIEVKSTFSTADGGSTKCACIIYDDDMLKIYNKERVASQQDNAKGNYWNMFMSLEDIYACSPYKNFVCFMLD